MSRKTATPYQDAAWIIALWRALHGGDPTPEDVAAEVIAGLSRYLPGTDHSFLSRELQPPSQALLSSALNPEPEDVEAPETEPTGPEEFEYSIHHYYFKFKGQWYCLGLPALTHSPTAA